MLLNEEQQTVVNAGKGQFKVEAAAGSGKTSVLVARTVRLLQENVYPENMLTLTFTSEAAKTLRTRIAEIEPIAASSSTERISGPCTFHSFSLSVCSKEHENFPFTLLSNPLATEGQCAKIGYEIAGKYDVNYRSLRSWISLQKRGRVTPEVAIATAEKQSENLKLALAYKKYDEALYASGTLDFDSLILETVKLFESRPDILDKYQYEFVMMDEAQDTSRLENILVELVSKKHGNLLVVGDTNQCQPPGTMVKMGCEWKGHRRTKQVLNPDKPIEDLQIGDYVQTWVRRRGQIVQKGHKVLQKNSRHYEGDLINIYQNNHRTKVTPNHWLWSTLVPNCRFQHIVYLMWKKEFGFRVGMCRTAVYKGNRNGLGGFASRCYEERAEKAWILGAYETKTEAHENELINSYVYGIPTCVFQPQPHHQINKEELVRIYKAVPIEHGMNCLKAHKKYFEYPIFSEKERPHSRYFKIQACNLIPEMMALPTQKEYCAAAVDRIEYEPYIGEVYSLEVDVEHTYVADNIIVGNSVYQWRGADPEYFRNMQEFFPNVQTLYLPTNYRSTQKIIEYTKKISPESELIQRLNTPNEEGIDPVITFYSTATREAQEVVNKLQNQDGTVVVLGRTNQSLRIVEDELADRDIKYYYLGDSGFYNRSEVKSVLAYLQCVVGITDASLCTAIRAPFFPSKYIKKKWILDEIKKNKQELERTAWETLTQAANSNRAIQEFVNFIRGRIAYRDLPAKDAVSYVLRDLKAYEYYHEEEAVDADNNPVENLKELVRVAAKYDTLKEFLNFIRRVQAASRRRTGVCLATGHAAKGKEWTHTYVIQASEGMIPHKRSTNIEEEQNLFYVMCSRAAKTLDISYTDTPSRFLKLEKDEVFD